MMKNMTMEQKRLLLDIAESNINHTCLQMKDVWTWRDFLQDEKMNAKDKEMRRIYEEKFGSLPVWKHYEDVVKARDELRMLLRA